MGQGGLIPGNTERDKNSSAHRPLTRPAERLLPAANRLPISTIKCENPGCGDQTETSIQPVCSCQKKQNQKKPPQKTTKNPQSELDASAPGRQSESAAFPPRTRIKTAKNPICIFFPLPPSAPIASASLQPVAVVLRVFFFFLAAPTAKFAGFTPTGLVGGGGK